MKSIQTVKISNIFSINLLWSALHIRNYRGYKARIRIISFVDMNYHYRLQSIHIYYLNSLSTLHWYPSTHKQFIYNALVPTYPQAVCSLQQQQDESGPFRHASYCWFFEKRGKIFFFNKFFSLNFGKHYLFMNFHYHSFTNHSHFNFIF